MSRFYLHTRKGVYYAELINPATGQRLTARSTGTKNRDEAAAIVGRWLSEGVPAVKGKAKKTIEEAAAYATVKKYIVTADICEAEAVELVNLLRKRGLIKYRVTEPKKSAQIFKDFLLSFWDYENSMYLRDKRAHGKSVTLKHCIDSARAIEKYYAPYFKDKLLCDIKRSDLREFGLWLKEERKLAAKTVNSKMHIATTALKWAYFEKIIPEYISEGLGGFVGGERKRDIFTDSEIEKLNNYKYWECKKSYIAYRLASTSALRNGEIRALRRQDIGEGILYIRHNFAEYEGLKKPKNNEERTVYLLPAVRALLMELLELNPIQDAENQFVFFGDNKPELPVNYNRFSKYLHKAIAKAGIELNGRLLDFHSLRHYCATKWANGTGDLRIVAKVTGHKSQSQAARYSDHIAEAEIVAMGAQAEKILQFPKAV